MKPPRYSDVHRTILPSLVRNSLLIVGFLVKHLLLGYDPCLHEAFLGRLRCLVGVVDFFGMVAVNFPTPVWYMEPPINPDKDIKPNDNDFNTEIEDVEARFRMIPCWV